jgi:hypothetical protein
VYLFQNWRLELPIRQRVDSVHVGLPLMTLFGDEIRLTSLSVSGLTLNISVDENGESSSGPDRLLLEIKNLTGGYPKCSFDVHYRVDGIARPPFTVVSMEAGGPGITSGHISAAFDGTCREGNLEVDGSLTLSPDFILDSSMAQLMAGTQIGTPIQTIRLRGTLVHPELAWPNAIAGAFGRFMDGVFHND